MPDSGITERGTQASMPGLGNEKPRGMTPATRHASPLRVTVRSTTPTSPPYSRCQAPKLSTITWLSPLRSWSAGRSARPRAAGTPSVSKKPGVTYSVSSSEGVPSRVVTSPAMWMAGHAPIDSTVRLWARQSSRSGSDAVPRVMFRAGYALHRRTSRPASAYGSGRRSTASTTENTAVLAPIPSASVATTMAA